MTNLTTTQIENIVLDSGVVYVNYGETDERILAPCKGNNEFSVEQKFTEIEANGLRSKGKGLKMMLSENAKMTVNLLDLSQENLHIALVGSKMDATSKAITNGDGRIPGTDYLKNVTLIGRTMKGEYKVITIYNALADGSFKVKTSDKDETVLEVTFEAHKDPTDSTKKLYKIEQLTSIDVDSFISVTSVSIPTTLDVAVGASSTIEATILPSTATVTNVSWGSSDNTVAKVNEFGIVTGVSAGTATITIITADGGYTDTCTVTVA